MVSNTITLRKFFLWNSQWFCDHNYYRLLFEDLKITNYLQSIFSSLKLPTSNFIIKRYVNKLIIQSNFHLLFFFRKKKFKWRYVMFLVRKHRMYLINHFVFKKSVYFFFKKILQIIYSYFFKSRYIRKKKIDYDLSEYNLYKWKPFYIDDLPKFKALLQRGNKNETIRIKNRNNRFGIYGTNEYIGVTRRSMKEKKKYQWKIKRRKKRRYLFRDLKNIFRLNMSYKLFPFRHNPKLTKIKENYYNNSYLLKKYSFLSNLIFGNSSTYIDSFKNDIKNEKDDKKSLLIEDSLINEKQKYSFSLFHVNNKSEFNFMNKLVYTYLFSYKSYMTWLYNTKIYKDRSFFVNIYKSDYIITKNKLVVKSIKKNLGKKKTFYFYYNKHIPVDTKDYIFNLTKKKKDSFKKIFWVYFITKSIYSFSRHNKETSLLMKKIKKQKYQDKPIYSISDRNNVLHNNIIILLKSILSDYRCNTFLKQINHNNLYYNKHVSVIQKIYYKKTLELISSLEKWLNKSESKPFLFSIKRSHSKLKLLFSKFFERKKWKKRMKLKKLNKFKKKINKKWIKKNYQTLSSFLHSNLNWKGRLINKLGFIPHEDMEVKFQTSFYSDWINWKFFTSKFRLNFYNFFIKKHFLRKHSHLFDFSQIKMSCTYYLVSYNILKLSRFFSFFYFKKKKKNRFFFF